MYKINQITVFTKETKNLITNILSDAFVHNKLIQQHFFKQSDKKRHAFMTVCTEYYSKFGVIFGAYNAEDKLVAVSLWNEPNSKSMAVGNILKGGMFGLFIVSMFKIGLPSFNRIMKSSSQLDKFHITQPHYYLFMLASAQKGAGRALLENNIALYQPKGTLYWESSVDKDNHSFYKSFGAEAIGEEVIGGVSNMFFVIKGAEEQK